MAKCKLCGISYGVKKNGICSKCEPVVESAGTEPGRPDQDNPRKIETEVAGPIVESPEAPELKIGYDPKKDESEADGHGAQPGSADSSSVVAPDPNSDGPVLGHVTANADQGEQVEVNVKKDETEENPKEGTPGESADTPPADRDADPDEEKDNPEIKEEVFSFPSRIRCEYCGSPNVRVTSTKGKIRYYECFQIVPICNGEPGTNKRTFKIMGKKI